MNATDLADQILDWLAQDPEPDHVKIAALLIAANEIEEGPAKAESAALDRGDLQLMRQQEDAK